MRGESYSNINAVISPVLVYLDNRRLLVPNDSLYIMIQNHNVFCTGQVRLRRRSDVDEPPGLKQRTESHRVFEQRRCVVGCLPKMLFIFANYLFIMRHMQKTDTID